MMASVKPVLKAVVLFWVIIANYEAIPSSNTALTRFDTLIVLGTPCRLDGTPSLEQRERVLEGVREFRAGVAPHMIVTGGPAHNHFVEADCMKHLAVEQGVPADDVIEENQARDTIQNIWFSHLIMEKHGWRSAEVISSPSHLPRTALILERYTGRDSFAWRTHAAHWPSEYTPDHIARIYWGEMRMCWAITRHGFGHSRWIPAS
jgi:uncharacterized SAM-binding protein YcdF (DUF218 family)